MREKILNSFLLATNNMLSMFLGESLNEVKRENFTSPVTLPLKDVYVNIDFMEKRLNSSFSVLEYDKDTCLTGSFIFSMSEDLAKRIASNMMGGVELTTFDDISRSAVSECANMIAGNAATILEDFVIDIMPPKLHSGINNQRFFDAQGTVVDLKLNGLQENLLVHLSIKNSI